MFRILSFTFCLGFVAAQPALADASYDMAMGMAGCLEGAGDAQAIANGLIAEDWSGDTDDEQGIGYLYPLNQQTEDTFLMVGLDGTWCHVESTVLSSETAAGLLRELLSDIEYDIDKDEMGCTMFNLGDGITATITSGGQDPICGAEDNSAIRFNFE